MKCATSKSTTSENSPGAPGRMRSVTGKDAPLTTVPPAGSQTTNPVRATRSELLFHAKSTLPRLRIVISRSIDRSNCVLPMSKSVVSISNRISCASAVKQTSYDGPPCTSQTAIAETVFGTEKGQSRVAQRMDKQSPALEVKQCLDLGNAQGRTFRIRPREVGNLHHLALAWL